MKQPDNILNELDPLIWRAADEYNIPRLEHSRFGWIKEDDIMVPIHGNVSVVPNVLYNLWHVIASQISCAQGQHVAADQPKCQACHMANVKLMNSGQMTM